MKSGDPWRAPLVRIGGGPVARTLEHADRVPPSFRPHEDIRIALYRDGLRVRLQFAEDLDVFMVGIHERLLARRKHFEPELAPELGETNLCRPIGRAEALAPREVDDIQGDVARHVGA